MNRHDFPYTDFHELNLDWFLSKFASLLAEWDEMQKQFASLDEAVKDLKDYVMNFFDSADFRQLINDKLDEMAENGTLMQLIAAHLPFVTPQMYGAVADGVNDDTEAIQTALNTGITVVFPKGDYLISETLEVSSTNEVLSHLKFSGNARIFANNDIGCLMNIGGFDQATDNKTFPLIIEGGVFDCNRVVTDAIHIYEYSNHVTLKSIRIINWIRYGIYTPTLYPTQFMIDHCIVYGIDGITSNTAINSNGSDNVITNCYIGRARRGLVLPNGGNLVSNIFAYNQFNVEPSVSQYEETIAFVLNGANDCYNNLGVHSYCHGVRITSTRGLTIHGISYIWGTDAQHAPQQNINVYMVEHYNNTIFNVDGLSVNVPTASNVTIQPQHLLNNGNLDYLTAGLQRIKSEDVQNTRTPSIYDVKNDFFNIYNLMKPKQFLSGATQVYAADSYYLIGYTTCSYGTFSFDVTNGFNKIHRITVGCQNNAFTLMKNEQLYNEAITGFDLAIGADYTTVNGIRFYPLYLKGKGASLSGCKINPVFGQHNMVCIPGFVTNANPETNINVALNITFE